MIENRSYENTRPLADIVNEIKDELRQVAKTRLEMLFCEAREARRAWKIFLPLIGAALLLLVTSYIFLIAASAGAVAVSINSPYRWPLALLLVCIVCGIGGLAASILARRELRRKNWFPRRTIAVLRRDRLWLRSERKVEHGEFSNR